MLKRFTAGVLLLSVQLGGMSATRAAAPEEGAQINFKLSKPGFVTVAIEDAEGKRVRNLVAAKWNEAGKQSERWDGLSDTGEPLPPGLYHWKGLVHEGISAQFEGAFNSPGNPPWPTAEIAAQRNVRVSGNGGWLSDHERPVCAYSEGNSIYFGAEIAEAGHSIMELDPAGNKVWGTLWLGLSGANAISTRAGILYVAGEKGWMKDSLAVHRLDAKTHKLLANPPDSEVSSNETAFIKVGSEKFSNIKGMVVTDKFIVLSLGDHNRLACFDVASGKYIKDVPLPGAGSIVLTKDDRLLAISELKVVRLDLENGSYQTVVAGPLVKPMGVAVSSAGNILVSDAGEHEQQVKVFSPEGKLIAHIGKSGGRSEGRFDAEAMSYPRAITVDAKDQVWVGEYSFLPKRISVWTMDGKLVRDWVGPSYYGGGGTLDPKDSSRAFYKGMEFTVAPWPEPAKLKAILFRPEDHLDLPVPTDKESRGEGDFIDRDFYAQLPQAPVYRGKRLYLLHDEGYGTKAIVIGEVQGDHLTPRAVFGSLDVLCKAWKKRYPDFVKSVPVGASGGNSAGVFLWQDTNGDGKAEPAEVQIQPNWRFGAMWGMRSWPTLNLYAQSADGKQVIEVKPKPDNDDLSYNLESASPIPLPPEIVKRGVTALSPDLDGNLIVNMGAGGDQGDKNNLIESLAPNGHINWSYPNPYPANWHNSPRSKVGDIQHTLNVEGVVSLGGTAGSVFQLNGNKGVRYLFTTDGLFVGQLYGDARNIATLSNCHQVSRGLRLDSYSLGDECFSGWLGRVQDGRVLQIVGKDSSNIMQVVGLDTLQRLQGGKLRLKKASTAAQQSSKEIAPERVEAIQMGGIASGWENVGKHKLLEEGPTAWFALGYQAYGLYLSMTIDKSKPFSNNGDDPKTLFKTGDAVDFRLAIAKDASPSRTAAVSGDQRFIFSMWKGKPVAVRYRFVVPGADAAHQSKFASPTGVAVVDDVSILKNVEVTIVPTAEGWRLTACIPWNALGLNKIPMGSLRGDVGLILSDPSGTRSVSRHYYFDRGSQVVSDLPSEVRVDPSKWRDIVF